MSRALLRPLNPRTSAVAFGLSSAIACYSCSKAESTDFTPPEPSARAASAAGRSEEDGAGDPETPLFGAVPVGIWAEYETRAPGARFRQVIALVGRTEDGDSVLETELRDAENPNSQSVITQETHAPGNHTGDRAKARVTQVGANDPMQYPDSARPSNAGLGLKAFGSRTYTATEEITVPGGTFLARKFVLRLPDGGESALWLDHHLFPTGIVKMQTLPPSRDPREGHVMELVGRGNGARPKIVKSALPFDAAGYQRQQTAGFVAPSAQ
jgi:hypothetical protein